MCQILLLPLKKVVRNLPVKTNLADVSATSNAVFPSVFRMLGSAPCWRRTTKVKIRTILAVKLLLLLSFVLKITSEKEKTYQHRHPLFPSPQPHAKGYNSSYLLNLDQHRAGAVI